MAIKIKQLTKKYNDLTVLENFNLTIKENQVTCLLGPSGSGKTTLLNIISGLIPYDSGEIIGTENKQISYIFQEDRLLPWATVLDNILFVLENQYDYKTAHTIAHNIIDTVGLNDYKDYNKKELSGGMKRRVAIARAFAFPSDIIIMDEPFKGLDVELKLNLLKSFKMLLEIDKRTVIFVTHDPIEYTFAQDNLGANLVNIEHF